MAPEKFREVLFERFAEKGDVCDNDWFETFVKNAREHGDPAWLDIDWQNETDSGNFSSGDESELLLSLSDKNFEAYWTESTFNGIQGPFEHYDEAVKALGYDPASFPPPTPDPWDEEE